MAQKINAASLKCLFIYILFLVLFSCNSQPEKSLSGDATVDSSTAALTKGADERFFPATKATERFDTTIADRHIQISITKKYLDSYVVNEYDTDAGHQIDKYWDVEVSLMIKQGSEVLVDTLFRKQQFAKYAEEGFMDVAMLQGYWLDKLDGDRIELFGTICKPETDWCLDYKHYFSVKNRTFEVVVQEDE